MKLRIDWPTSIITSIVATLFLSVLSSPIAPDALGFMVVSACFVLISRRRRKLVAQSTLELVRWIEQRLEPLTDSDQQKGDSHTRN